MRWPERTPGQRPGRVILGLALLAILTPAGAIGPTLIPRVDEIIDAPRALFGRTRDQIERNLGRPVSDELRQVARPREPRQTHTVHELTYPGLRIRVHPAHGLLSVRLSGPGYRLPRGLDIGASRHHVEETLGEPQEAADARYLYLYADGYPDTVEFLFRDDRVHRIEWSYWID